MRASRDVRQHVLKNACFFAEVLNPIFLYHNDVFLLLASIIAKMLTQHNPFILQHLTSSYHLNVDRDLECSSVNRWKNLHPFGCQFYKGRDRCLMLFFKNISLHMKTTKTMVRETSQLSELVMARSEVSLPLYIAHLKKKPPAYLVFPRHDGEVIL